MAKNSSFDIVSEIDMQEVDNAVNQAIKEIQQRYDLKDSKTEVTLNKSEQFISINTKDDYSRKASFASGLLKPKSNRISFTDKIKLLFKIKS